MTKKILSFLSLWLPPVLWMAMIFKFSSGSIPSASQNYWLDFVVKKIGHIILFATLAILSYRALVNEGVTRKKAAIWAVIISFTYGISDEIHQMFTQGREAKVRDVLIDGAGASLIIFLVYRYLPKFPKKFQNFLLQFNIK